jgi:hypothetical protein
MQVTWQIDPFGTENTPHVASKTNHAGGPFVRFTRKNCTMRTLMFYSILFLPLLFSVIAIPSV